MGTKKPPTKGLTLLQKLGTPKQVMRYAELTLQTPHQTFKDIIRQMPGVPLTIGKLASYRRDHERDIGAARENYMIRHKKVPPVGASNVYSKEELAKIPPAPQLPKVGSAPKTVEAPKPPPIDEAKIIFEALRDWKPGSPGFKTGSAFAAMKVNQARIAAGIKQMTCAEDIEADLRAKVRLARSLEKKN